MMTEDGPLALRKAWWNADCGGSGSVGLMQREGLEHLESVLQMSMQFIGRSSSVAGHDQTEQRFMRRDQVVVELAPDPTVGDQEAGPVGELQCDPQQPSRIAGREHLPMEGGVEWLRTTVVSGKGDPCRFDPSSVVGIALGHGSFQSGGFKKESDFVEFSGLGGVYAGHPGRTMGVQLNQSVGGQIAQCFTQWRGRDVQLLLERRDLKHLARSEVASKNGAAELLISPFGSGRWLFIVEHALDPRTLRQRREELRYVGRWDPIGPEIKEFRRSNGIQIGQCCRTCGAGP